MTDIITENDWISLGIQLKQLLQNFEHKWYDVQKKYRKTKAYQYCVSRDDFINLQGSLDGCISSYYDKDIYTIGDNVFITNVFYNIPCELSPQLKTNVALLQDYEAYIYHVRKTLDVLKTSHSTKLPYKMFKHYEEKLHRKIINRLKYDALI